MVKLSPDEAWKFWNESLGCPKYILAPMVNASELQFRILCKRYGVDLAYTPMLHSRMLYESREYRPKMHPMVKELPSLYGSAEADVKYELPKTIAQVCGSEPDTVVTGCKLIESSVQAVDLNCGCPQGIAKRGHYGSFLLDQPSVILNVVSAMVENLKVPVTVKIRIVDDIPELDPTPEADMTKTGGLASYRTDIIDLCPRTFKLIADLEDLGVAAICIHGRTSSNKGHEIRGAEWGLMKEIVKRSKIPIIANGSVRTREDADACLEFTGAAAVMSAVGLLSNPAMFATGPAPTITQLMLELLYLYENVKIDGKSYTAPIKGHIFHALHHILQTHTDIRSQLDAARGLEEVKKVCEASESLSAEEKTLDVFSNYYYRHLRKKSDTVHLLEPATPQSKKLRLHADQENHESTQSGQGEAAATS